MIAGLRRAWAMVRAAIGLDEVVVLAALVLIAVGFWQAWRPGAFLVPGLVLLWISLPRRLPFIVRSPDPEKAKRRTP